MQRSRFLAKAQAELRARQREFVFEIEKRVAAHPQPSKTDMQRNRVKPINTKDELFKLLGLS